MIPNEHLVAPSDMPPSFRPWFSQKLKLDGADDVNQKCPLDLLQPVAFPVSESSLKESEPFKDIKYHMETSPAKLPSEAASTESCPTICAFRESSGVSSATPSKDKSLKSIDAMGTPNEKYAEVQDCKFVTDDNTTSSLNKLARRPPSSRSLKFNTPVKHKEVVSEHNAGDLPFDDDVFDILPENLIQSVLCSCFSFTLLSTPFQVPEFWHHKNTTRSTSSVVHPVRIRTTSPTRFPIEEDAMSGVRIWHLTSFVYRSAQ
ncbi:hypothetical protein Fmac_027831 [Flemingia macrophylla]|uniref:Uncharacterized protein n=1 Tax=Flemingia macrophylla TaxID=520843 RepID=A0ABD1LIV0_9FABA